MPWAKQSGRTTPLPPNWNTIRQTILNRDNHQCTAFRGDTSQRCTEQATDVDHIKEHDNHNPNNLTSLCKHHHARKTAAQGGSRARTPKNKPKHPGINP